MENLKERAKELLKAINELGFENDAVNEEIVDFFEQLTTE